MSRVFSPAQVLSVDILTYERKKVSKMVNIIMHGCNGKMGQTITNIVKNDAEATIVAGIDLYDGIKNDYPVFSSLKECTVKGDVIIDFSNSKAVDELLDYCDETKTPVVLCTTGLSEEQLKKVDEVSTRTAVLRSANMSLGVNLIMKVLKEVSAKLVPAGFDIEIVEKHHRLKLDAPSGTAIALADSINEEFNNEYEYVYDRSSRRELRPDKEIGISAVRGGTIVGEHDVIFAGTDEVITISHTAYSKALFAQGAVSAAKYLAGKGAGMYSMKNVLE